MSSDVVAVGEIGNRETETQRETLMKKKRYKWGWKKAHTNELTLEKKWKSVNMNGKTKYR